ncbi:MAG TPA: amino acid racemase [Woeseiaceae bacterium]|nr:amino acid racemase [Woeseiaceae bacterium]
MTSKSLTVGVLGGLGPEATVDFMTRVIAETPASRDQDHVHLIVDQNPSVPDRQDAIFRQGADPGPVLAAMAKRLQEAGCDFLVMPCNTAQAYEDNIRAAVSIPLLSIIEVSIEAIPAGLDSIAVLATPACLATGKYQQALAAKGKEVVELTTAESQLLMKVIYALKSGARDDWLPEAVHEIIRELCTRGAELVILGCTEVPLLLDRLQPPVPIISSTDELARRSVLLARGEIPLPGKPLIK